MTAPRLPEMPEPVAYSTQIKEGRVLFEPRISLNCASMVGIFTADQLRADRLAVWKAAMEAAAKVCDSEEERAWHAKVWAAALACRNLAEKLRSLPSPE